MASDKVRGGLALIDSELVSLGKMLEGYASVEAAVGWTLRNTPGRAQDFTARQQGLLVGRLERAEAGFRVEIVNAADVKTKLTRVLSILKNAPVYVAPPPEPARAAAVAVKRAEDFKLLREWTVYREEPHSGCVPYFWEERLYSASDPKGAYQKYVNGEYNSSFTPDSEYIEKYVAPLLAPVAPVEPAVVDKWTSHEFGVGGESRREWEVRQCSADDPKGEYQLWCNNLYSSDYTERQKQKEAETKVAAGQAVRMETLLAELRGVGES